MKNCIKCKEEKETFNFYLNSRYKDGYFPYCKQCCQLRMKKYYKDNIDEFKEINKIYYNDNRDKMIEKSINYQKNNPDKKKKNDIKYYYRNKSNLTFNMNIRLSTQIRKSLKGNKNGKCWELLVGYNLNQLKLHFEGKFTKDMSWEEFIKGEIVIGHILPKELFEYESYDDPLFKICWSLDNLRPEWHSDNSSNIDKLPDGRLARHLSKEEKLIYIKSLGYNI